MPWELFRPLLEPMHTQERKSNAGRKPFDVVLMFKILILQTLYNLADEQAKNGEVPPDWGDAKRAQKDVDGRWTRKRGKPYFG